MTCSTSTPVSADSRKLPLCSWLQEPASGREPSSCNHPWQCIVMLCFRLSKLAPLARCCPALPAGIVKTLCEAVAQHCPNAVLNIIRWAAGPWHAESRRACPSLQQQGSLTAESIVWNRHSKKCLSARCSNSTGCPHCLRCPVNPPLQQPGQLDRAHLRRGAEEGGRVRQAQGGALWLLTADSPA